MRVSAIGGFDALSLLHSRIARLCAPRESAVAQTDFTGGSNKDECGRLEVRLIAAAMVLAGAVLQASCAINPTFAFPVEEGSISAGRQAFIDHQCTRCHTVAGERLPEPPNAASPRFELGGETSQVKAYSDIVTSIINPNHRISDRFVEDVLRQTLPPSESPMPLPNLDTMTVKQLIDLVAYLDSRYVLIDDYEPKR
jgi:hypothetical protein